MDEWIGRGWDGDCIFLDLYINHANLKPSIYIVQYGKAMVKRKLSFLNIVLSFSLSVSVSVPPIPQSYLYAMGQKRSYWCEDN